MYISFEYTLTKIPCFIAWSLVDLLKAFTMPFVRETLNVNKIYKCIYQPLSIKREIELSWHLWNHSIKNNVGILKICSKGKIVNSFQELFLFFFPGDYISMRYLKFSILKNSNIKCEVKYTGMMFWENIYWLDLRKSSIISKKNILTNVVYPDFLEKYISLSHIHPHSLFMFVCNI